MKLSRTLSLCFLVAPVCFFPLFAGQPPQTIPAVNVEKVVSLTESQPMTYVGTVSGAETVSIVARVSGTLWEASFREGGMVNKGDVLFHIEDTIYEANVRIAEALIKQAEAELELAVKEHERSENLLRTRAISAQSFDMTLATMELREAKLEEAKANLVLAQQDLDYCRIVSPISGRIGENVFSEGNYITPVTNVLATIVQYQPVKVKFSLSEPDFFRYFDNRETMKNVAISIQRTNGEMYTGKVDIDFVDNLVDPRTDTLTINLVCGNESEQLLPGGYVRVQLAQRYDPAVSAVSTSAVIADGSTHYVYVVGQDNLVERREVVIGDVVYRRQVILSGLEPGEQVVSGGLNKVRPGIQVRPVLVE